MAVLGLKAIIPKNTRIVDAEHGIENCRKEMEAYLKSIRDELNAGYREVPPSPRYRRTKKLQRGWNIKIRRYGISGDLTNDATDKYGRQYAVYVVGPRRDGGRGVGEHQTAKMRRRGWKSISDVARRRAPEYQRIMNRAIRPRPVNS